MSCRIGNVFLLAVLPRDTHEITDLQASVARIVGRPVLNVRKVWIGDEQLREPLLPIFFCSRLAALDHAEHDFLEGAGAVQVG